MSLSQIFDNLPGLRSGSARCNNRFFIAQALLVMFCTIACSTESLWAQPGGKTYQFLEVTNSARAAALGGQVVAAQPDGVELAFHNPSLLDTTVHSQMALNYVDYFAGIHYGYVSAATRAGKKGMLAAGIHYLNYGSFEGADELGNLTGTFRAADYSVNLTFTHPVDSLITAGLTMKSVFSGLETYRSTALAFDAGLTYCNPGRGLAIAVVMRNLGWQLQKYYPNDVNASLPFNLALGFSKSLQYAPLTFYLVADHLEKWDLTYETDEDRENATDPFTGEIVTESGFDEFIDKAMRHLTLGTELKLGKNLVFRLGYNYRRRQEMKISSKPGTVGFSWGLGLNLRKFSISYGRPAWHLAGGANHISMSVNLNELGKNF